MNIWKVFRGTEYITSAGAVFILLRKRYFLINYFSNFQQMCTGSPLPIRNNNGHIINFH